MKRMVKKKETKIVLKKNKRNKEKRKRKKILKNK